MLKFSTGAAVAAALLGAASAAQATTTFQQINLIDGSSFFGATITNELGAFTHEFDFTTAGPVSANASVITILLSGFRDIDFSAIDLDGNAFHQVSFDPGAESWALDPVALGSGPHALILHGAVVATTRNATSSSYAGTLNVASVPEPATWALMILGFGGAGAMLRARRRGGVVAA